jgi:hypothetical protein
VFKGVWKQGGTAVPWPCPEKRSQALRGRNLTREIRVDGAPKVPRASGGAPTWGRFVSGAFDTVVLPEQSSAVTASLSKAYIRARFSRMNPK